MEMTTACELDVETREGWVGYEVAKVLGFPPDEKFFMSATVDLPCGTLWLFQIDNRTYYALEGDDDNRIRVCNQFGTDLFVFSS